MTGYTGDHAHSGNCTPQSGSLAVPAPARPAGSRKGSHASANSVDLAADGDAYYGQQSMTEQDQDLPLELDTFQAADFNVARLVGSLTDSLITASKQGGGGGRTSDCW